MTNVTNLKNIAVYLLCLISITLLILFSGSKYSIFFVLKYMKTGMKIVYSTPNVKIYNGIINLSTSNFRSNVVIAPPFAKNIYFIDSLRNSTLLLYIATLSSSCSHFPCFAMCGSFFRE